MIMFKIGDIIEFTKLPNDWSNNWKIITCVISFVNNYGKILTVNITHFDEQNRITNKTWHIDDSKCGIKHVNNNNIYNFQWKKHV